MAFIRRNIVNGNLLRRFTDKRVSIIVDIQDIDSSGKILKGKTTDEQLIRVSLSEPVNSPIQGWVEIIGVPTGTDHIRCDEVSKRNQSIGFPNQMLWHIEREN